jgi:hypothetical protein
MNRKDPFFFGTVNHLLECGVFDGSRIPISTFSFKSPISFGRCALGTGIGFRF